MAGLTYRNRQEELDDKAQQARLLKALDAAPSQLRRDKAGWWVIGGRHGSLQTWGDGKSWVLYVICRSKQHWTFTKKRLSFMTVTQDGDDEGCLRLLELPTSEQAVVIRDVLKLRKRVAYSPETLERKRASMARAGLARGAPEVPSPRIQPQIDETAPLQREGGPVVEDGKTSGEDGR